MTDQREKIKKDYLQSFIRTRFLSVLITSIVPMILVSSIILFQFYTSYREKAHAHLITLVKKHKQNIDNFLKDKLKDILTLAKTSAFEEFKNESFLKDRLKTLQKVYGPVFVDLGVINEDGIQIAYAGPFKLGEARYSDTNWFKKAIESQYYISDVFLGLRGLPHFIITVSDTYHGKRWILRATIDFMAFNTLVEKIRIGETGFAFILNRAGEFQTKPLLEITTKREPYTNLLASRVETEDEIQVVEEVDDTGEKNIYVAAFLKQGDWLLVYQQRASDVFSDFRKALGITLIILLLGSMSTFSMAFVRFKNMVGRMDKTEKEKQIMNEQMIQTGKLASVGELAAGIAHEINNPVAIMVEEAGWIEDLLEEEEFHESNNLSEFKRAAKQIRTQGKRCKEITLKLLSFARKTDSRIQEVQLNEIIEELVTISSQRAKYSNIDITTNLQKNLPNVNVSQTEMQQVFLNIINNALDAMEKSEGTINISSRLEDDLIVVEIADDGPGIPEANLSRIFDPFFTTKQVGKGTGLGLSICYGIIQKLGGEIVVRSVIGAGTVFSTRIPIDSIKTRKERDHGETIRNVSR